MSGTVVIEHRDALIYMLSEAAELEHAIMCQYHLFAGFSLKTSVDKEMDERQLRRAAQGPRRCRDRARSCADSSTRPWLRTRT